MSPYGVAVLTGSGSDMQPLTENLRSTQSDMPLNLRLMSLSKRMCVFEPKYKSKTLAHASGCTECQGQYCVIIQFLSAK